MRAWEEACPEGWAGLLDPCYRSWSRLCSESEAAVLNENSRKGFNDRTISSSSKNSSKISQPQTIQMGDILPNIRELTYFLYMLVGRRY